MAQFYTLEEAARVLGMSPEELKAKAQHREVRAFLDGGSWRFRVADVDELARRRGLGATPSCRCPTWTCPCHARQRVRDRPLGVPARRSPMTDLGRPRRAAAGGADPGRTPTTTSCWTTSAAPDTRGELQLGDHRHGARRASCRATPTSAWSPTMSRGRATPTSAWRPRPPRRRATPTSAWRASSLQAAERLRRDADRRGDLRAWVPGVGSARARARATRASGRAPSPARRPRCRPASPRTATAISS